MENKNGYKIEQTSLHTCRSTLEKIQLAQVVVTLSQLHVSRIPGEQLPPAAGDIKPSRFDHAKFCGCNESRSVLKATMISYCHFSYLPY